MKTGRGKAKDRAAIVNTIEPMPVVKVTVSLPLFYSAAAELL
jgi:hypothetical protein